MTVNIIQKLTSACMTIKGSEVKMWAIKCHSLNLVLAYNEANDGYFWTHLSVFYELIKRGEKEHRFCFPTKEEAITKLNELRKQHPTWYKRKDVCVCNLKERSENK